MNAFLRLFTIAVTSCIMLFMMMADEAGAQFFPHNDTTYTFVSTTNAFGRIQTYDGEDGRYEDIEDKVIDRLYQVVGLNDDYVWNPNDDPDINLVDTVYYASEDSLEYFRELVMDNSFRADPPAEVSDIQIHTLVRQFFDEKYALARLGVVRDENDYLLSVLLRGKIFETFGGATYQWDAERERLYIFDQEAAIGLEAITLDATGVSLLDFDDYDSTEPERDNARDFARWDEMVKEGFPSAPLVAGPDGGWAYMNFGNVANIATGDTAYVWLAYTHGRDLDEVDDRLDAALLKAEEIGIVGDPVSVDPENGELPATARLEQNYPNPFNPSTTIGFELQEAADTRLSVFDLSGREVATLVNSRLSAGTHSVSFDASGLASGIYVYRLQTGEISLTRRMTLIK